jgi:hypothetical protein
LTKALAELKNVVRVTTGHDEASAVMGAAAGASAINANPRTMSIKDLQEYADFSRDFLEAVKQAIAAGKSAEEAAKTLQLPERYKDYDLRNAGANVRAIYRESWESNPARWQLRNLGAEELRNFLSSSVPQFLSFRSRPAPRS